MVSKKELMDKARILKKKCYCNKPISGYNKGQLAKYILSKETQRAKIKKEPKAKPIKKTKISVLLKRTQRELQELKDKVKKKEKDAEDEYNEYFESNNDNKETINEYRKNRNK